MAYLPQWMYSLASYFSPNQNTGLIVNHTEGYAYLGNQYITSDANYYEALRCNAFSSSIQKISSAIGEVTFHCDNREVNHRLERPNAAQTGAEFFESIVHDLLLYGQTFIEAQLGTPTRPFQLIPHLPKHIKVHKARGGGAFYFEVPRDNNRRIDGDRMMWIRDLSRTSIECHSRLDSLGLQVNVLNASEQLAEAIMKRSIHASYVLKSDEPITEAEFLNTHEAFKAFQATGKRTGGVIQLDKGKSLEMLGGVKPMEADLLNVRMHFKNDIASGFGIPPFLVGGASDTKYNNMAQQIQHMHRNAISPILGKLSRELSRQFRVDVVADDHILQKGDYDMQAKTQIALVQAGIYTPNEARAKLGDGPCDGGEVLRPPPTTQINLPDSDQQTNPPE